MLEDQKTKFDFSSLLRRLASALLVKSCLKTEYAPTEFIGIAREFGKALERNWSNVWDDGCINIRWWAIAHIISTQRFNGSSEDGTIGAMEFEMAANSNRHNIGTKTEQSATKRDTYPTS